MPTTPQTESDEMRYWRKFMQETEWKRRGAARDAWMSLIIGVLAVIAAPWFYSSLAEAEQNHTTVMLQIWLLIIYNILGKTGIAIAMLIIAAILFIRAATNFAEMARYAREMKERAR